MGTASRGIEDDGHRRRQGRGDRRRPLWRPDIRRSRESAARLHAPGGKDGARRRFRVRRRRGLLFAAPDRRTDPCDRHLYAVRPRVRGRGARDRRDRRRRILAQGEPAGGTRRMTAAQANETIDYPFVRLSFEGPLAIVTLNDPDRLNAMGDDMAQSLAAALAEIAKPRRRCRAVLLTGEGRAFCAGYNLMVNRKALAEGKAMIMPLGGAETLYHPMLRRLHALPVPLIAGVNGLAIGIGLGLAMAADYVVMADDAWVQTPFKNLASAPESGLTWLRSGARPEPRTIWPRSRSWLPARNPSSRANSRRIRHRSNRHHRDDILTKSVIALVSH